MKLYIASPLGFSELGRLSYKTFLGVISEAGFEILDPWELTDKKLFENVRSKHDWQDLNRIIAQNNIAAIHCCDGIVAILDGPDVDSGTAWECGYGAAKGKRVLGYRGDFRVSGDNEGSLVNLQVEYCLAEIVTTLQELPAALQRVFR